MKSIKPMEAIVDVVRKAHVNLLTKSQEYMSNPRQRRLMAASAAVTFTSLLATNVAHAAASDGLAGMFSKGATQGTSAKESLGTIFSAVGFGGAGYGGLNMWKKTKDENSRITGTQIWGPLLGGAALGATGFMMLMSGETVGIDSSQQGVVPS